MSKIKKLEFGKVYHIYNRGVNKMPIYRTQANHQFFLKLYFERIGPLVDTYAWCMMKNHFHFMIRVKSRMEIVKELSAVIEPDRLIGLDPSKQFSNFFVAYAKAFNKQEKRKGNLFERPFGRIEVDSLSYFKDLVVYIHRNPVHHGITTSPRDYEWTSFHNYFSVKPCGLNRDMVLSWFSSTIAFKAYHRKPQDVEEIQGFILDDKNEER
jgi:REP element-mobilizing transposase RayT